MGASGQGDMGSELSWMRKVQVYGRIEVWKCKEV